ncbi:response regulator [Photobacterium sp. ZSDE20]|uniref:Response regulator n=1 Tax=Photobacterium pectinilyticum TaxID=2906793 RepID=A0ABT1N8B3_9GAMM|nr:response regulator [Photobacterium sp. ZSDE20]MCQ1059921.1 response regulator [Photobacterium sp. ZSDE20]MDD1826514.1 response regulator [Photobacterium sp. ZSDE20]
MNQVLFHRQFNLSYESLAHIRRVLDDRASALQLSPDLIQSIKLVCSEYCANLLDHQQIPATLCTISYGKFAGQYRFAISDNGSPWPAQTQHLSDAVLPDLPCESGMGLAIIRATFPDFSYQILPDHNKIEFTLPLQSVRKHLVIVDDSRSQLTMLTSYLEQSYQLSIFSQADDALKWLQTNHCDLVLTDLWMPNINGLEFRRQVGHLRHHRLLPFIFLSGDTESDTMTAVTQSGIDDFLAKPINKQHLLQVLDRVLKRHHHLLDAFEDNLLQRLEHAPTPGVKQQTSITVGNFNIHLSREPEISGDFFIHQRLADGAEMVILGDLMGHGIVAKANGGICYGLIQGLLLNPDQTPAQLCDRLNQHLYQAQSNNLVCLLVIHLTARNTVTLYNAGMPKPILCDASSCLHIDETIGLLGLFDNLQMESCQLTLNAGNSLHVYSDGLLEAELPEHEKKNMTRMSIEERHQYLWQRDPDNHEDDRTLVTLSCNH